MYMRLMRRAKIRLKIMKRKKSLSWLFDLQILKKIIKETPLIII